MGIKEGVEGGIGRLPGKGPGEGGGHRRRFGEQVEKNEKLYEALLKSEREKIALLERLLGERD